MAAQPGAVKMSLDEAVRASTGEKVKPLMRWSSKNGRRKQPSDYIKEYPDLTTVTKAVNEEGEVAEVIFCRFCCVDITTRSDRIKEHLKSKRHNGNKKAKTEGEEPSAVSNSDQNGNEDAESVKADVGAKKRPSPLKESTQSSKRMANGAPGGRGVTVAAPQNTKMIRLPVPTTPRNVVTWVQPAPANLQRSNLDLNVANVMMPVIAQQRIPSEPGPVVTPPPESNLRGKIAEKKPDPSPSNQQQWYSVVEEADAQPEEQMYSVEWNGFDSNLRRTFCRYRKDELFYDVSLVCDEGIKLNCHKIILAANSEEFENMFLTVDSSNPNLIILKGCHLLELNLMLDFMYEGQINLRQDQLEPFLDLAKILSFKGLKKEDQQES